MNKKIFINSKKLNNSFMKMDLLSLAQKRSSVAQILKF
jgi:hypothetical protein